MKRVLRWSNTACCCPSSPWFASRPSPCSAPASPPCSAPWPASSERPAEFYSLSHERHRQGKVCVSGPDRGGLGGFERAVSHRRCGPCSPSGRITRTCRPYIIHRPLFPPLILSVHFYALLALYLLEGTRLGVSAARGDRRGRVEGLSSFEAGLLRRHG